MSDAYPFAGLLLLVAAVGVLALLSNRLTERIKIPAPLLVFVAAAVAVEVIGNLHQPREQLVERLMTVALIFILFDGGLNMGWPKFRVAAAPIAIVGVLGTFLTAAAAAIPAWRSSVKPTTALEISSTRMMAKSAQCPTAPDRITAISIIHGIGPQK